MTGQQLVEKIHKLKLEETELTVDVRIKTGYDEGEIWSQSLKSVNKKGVVELTSNAKLVGGW